MNAARRVSLAVLATALGVTALGAGAAYAHLIHDNGTWTYRYLTRPNQSDCSSGDNGSDPLNVVFYQYGQGDRMNTHAEQDTHWGFYSGAAPRDDQWICGDDNDHKGNYSINDHKNFDDQEGHGGIFCLCAVRAHFRIFYSPHPHDSITDKWSTIDVHHEHVAFSSSTVLTHHIDEPWEQWEQHIGGEFGSAGHNYWYDYYARQGGQYLQGFYDDGEITRVGGLHNGSY